MNFVILVTVTLHVLKKALVLFNSGFLLLNADFLRLENLQLLSLTFDFTLTYFCFFSEPSYVNVAVPHNFCVSVQESRIRNETRLKFVILLSELGLLGLELELRLGKVLLLCDVSLLILVHLPSFVQEPSCRRHRVEFLGLNKFLVVVHLFKISIIFSWTFFHRIIFQWNHFFSEQFFHLAIFSWRLNEILLSNHFYRITKPSQFRYPAKIRHDLYT